MREEGAATLRRWRTRRAMKVDVKDMSAVVGINQYDGSAHTICSQKEGGGKPGQSKIENGRG